MHAYISLNCFGWVGTSVLLYIHTHTHTCMHIYLSIALVGLESRGTRIFLVISVLMIKITRTLREVSLCAALFLLLEDTC